MLSYVSRHRLPRSAGADLLGDQPRISIHFGQEERMSFRSFARSQRHCATSSERIRCAFAEALEPRRLLTSIPIANASFESATLSDGQSQQTVSEWTWSAPELAGAEILNPSTNQITDEAADGANVAHVTTEGGDLGDATLIQVLSATLEANTTYTLSGAAGTGSGTWEVGLYAGETQLLRGGATSGGTARSMN